MSEVKKAMNNEELEGVSGGITSTVNTGRAVDAVVRSGPGTGYAQIASLKNGTQVNTTGNNVYNGADGRTWYEINFPLYGWMAGSLIGFY